jgi:hypothetical protein
MVTSGAFFDNPEAATKTMTQFMDGAVILARSSGVLVRLVVWSCATCYPWKAGPNAPGFND